MTPSEPVSSGRVLAVVFAGGVGRRMHSSAVPKQFLELYGKPVIVRTLELFEKRAGEPADALVMIHDGVRPLVSIDDLSRNLEAARAHGGAVTTAPAVETIAVVDADGRIASLVPREDCRLARAPQTFRLGDLLAAHRAADEAGRDDVIDTVTLMRDAGFPAPVAVQGPPENIKITTPQDFLLFKQIVEAREAQRGWTL